MPPADRTNEAAVWPTLRARNARALIKFLVEAFGFEEAEVYGEGDVVNHAELHWSLGGGVMLGPAGPADDGSRGENDPWARRGLHAGRRRRRGRDSRA